MRLRVLVSVSAICVLCPISVLADAVVEGRVNLPKSHAPPPVMAKRYEIVTNAGVLATKPPLAVVDNDWFGETVILCRSADRRSKERAMHDKFSRRIEEALERLAGRIARSKKRLDPATVNRQIGRILQPNQRAAARFALETRRAPSSKSLRAFNHTTSCCLP